jgi:hypothetical protein
MDSADRLVWVLVSLQDKSNRLNGSFDRGRRFTKARAFWRAFVQASIRLSKP